MGFLDSLKEKALEASEAVKEKTTSATEAIVDTALKIKCATNWHTGEFNNEEGKPECFFQKFVLIVENILQKPNIFSMNHL